TLRDLPESVRRGSDDQPACPVSVPCASLGNGHGNGHANDHLRRASGSLIQNRSDYERRLIEQALEDSHFNRSSAARSLGISRVTLHKKIKQYGLTNLP